jgi:hypothetical protein
MNQSDNERNTLGKRMFLLGKIAVRIPQKRRRCIVAVVI